MKYTSNVIYNKIVTILVNDFQQDISVLSLDTNLIKDLDFDSLDYADLYAKLEESLKLKERVHILEVIKLRTIEDIINLVMKLQ